MKTGPQLLLLCVVLASVSCSTAHDSNARVVEETGRSQAAGLTGHARGGDGGPESMKVPLSRWTRITVAGQTIYLADRPSLASQGLAGTQPNELGNGAVYFLLAKPEWGDFDNQDHGYGAVHFDIEIAFLDSSGTVLSINFMPAETGRATPPPSTTQAIEARPGWFSARGFQAGRESPVLIQFRPHRALDSDECYLSICNT